MDLTIRGEEIFQKVIKGNSIDVEEALYLYEEKVQPLQEKANLIREKYCGDEFHLCTIVNGKSGLCNEDCKFCAQSTKYQGNAPKYEKMGLDEILEEGKASQKAGIHRFSIVTSGKNLTESEREYFVKAYQSLNGKIDLCASHGLVSQQDLRELKKAGVTRYHCNLESSKENFEKICTTHTYDEKIATIKKAMKEGLSVCSGGIFGMGETKEDRINMAFHIKKLGIDSVPMNLFTKIKGTPLYHIEEISQEEFFKTVAIYRFILKDKIIRIAAGRDRMDDRGLSLFLGGANGAITGDMLTTTGTKTKEDIALIKALGFSV